MEITFSLHGSKKFKEMTEMYVCVEMKVGFALGSKIKEASKSSYPIG